MKRIITGGGVILFIGALVAGATGAFFSDTETSTGNTFAAGAIDLLIDNTSYGFDWNDPAVENPQGNWGQNSAHTWTLRNLDECGPNSDLPCLFFDFHDLKPGDYGEDTISVHVQNDAWACMAFDVTATPENNVNEPEVDAGDTLNNGNLDGELQNYLNFAFWLDDGDNVYENDEGPLLFNDSLADLNSDWQALADSLNNGQPLPANEEGAASFIGKFWCFGAIEEDPVDAEINGDLAPTAETTGFNCLHLNPQDNIAQTDSVEVNVHFYAEQSRNNGDFLCSNLPPVNEEEEVEGTITVLKVLDTAEDGDDGDPVPTESSFAPYLVGATQVTLGVPTSFPAGAYVIDETNLDPDYIQTFGGDCDALGNITLNNGDSLTCTITNTFDGIDNNQSPVQ